MDVDLVMAIVTPVIVRLAMAAHAGEPPSSASGYGSTGGGWGQHAGAWQCAGHRPSKEGFYGFLVRPGEVCLLG